MISLEALAPASDLDSNIFAPAREALSGKRIALIGFPDALALDLTRVIQAADGFTRSLTPRQVQPSSDLLKPYELILLDVRSSAGTGWLEREELARVAERCIAVGDYPTLLRVATGASLTFREYWPSSAPPEELLLRCVLGLGAARLRNQSAAPAGSTVVLADDDTSVTGIVRRAFERNGLTCELASSGGDALKLISKLKPCAAVLDVNMPDIDGFEVLSRLKSMAEVAATRVILLTACEKEADIIRGFSLGADDYVCKPFNPMELTIRLMRVLGPHLRHGFTIMRCFSDVYVKSGAAALAAICANQLLAYRLANLIHDPALRWAGACVILQAGFILTLGLYLISRRAYSHLIESISQQLRPAIDDRVLALALGGETWSSGVPRLRPARRVLEESIVHALNGLTQSGRERIAHFTVAQGFERKWEKEFSSSCRKRRKQSVARLGLISKECTSSVIEAALRDPHPAVRIEAARALLLEGGQHNAGKVFRAILLEPLLTRALLASDLKRHARYLLSTTVPELLAEGEPLATTRCLEFMIAWERAVPSFEVEPFLNKRCSPEVWSLVLKILPYVPLDDSVEEHLLSALTSTNVEVRCSAARAAGHLKLQRLVPYLTQALNQDREFAIASAGAMARIGDSGERHLERAVSGSDRRAAAVAMEALEQLAVGLR